jgi:hypothetical protein
MSKIVIRPNKGRLNLKSFFGLLRNNFFYLLCSKFFSHNLRGKNYVHNRQKKYFCLLRS